MFDIGWTELMVIGIVALIVVGPKDLPKMFRTLGQMTAKARGMAREFQRAMDDAADSSGVKDMARDLRKATDPQGMGLDELDKMRNWDPLKDDAKAKGAKPAPSDSSGGDDEEAFDQIAAEMDNIRKPKAPKADTPAPTDVPPAAPPKAPAASPERQDSAPDAQDKGKA